VELPFEADFGCCDLATLDPDAFVNVDKAKKPIERAIVRLPKRIPFILGRHSGVP
jgi:hypothetical protein